MQSLKMKKQEELIKKDNLVEEFDFLDSIRGDSISTDPSCSNHSEIISNCTRKTDTAETKNRILMSTKMSTIPDGDNIASSSSAEDSNQIFNDEDESVFLNDKKSNDLAQLLSINLPTSKNSTKRRRIRHVMSDDALSTTAREARRREQERLNRLEKLKPVGEMNIEVIQLSDDEGEQCGYPVHGRISPLESLGAKTGPKERRRSDQLEDTRRTEEGLLLINDGKPSGDPDVFAVAHLTNILQPHQIGGVRFLYDNVIESLRDFDTSPGFGCILAHSMGLGKTIQVITFVEIILRCTSANRALIMVPINTLQNWLNEFDKWLPRLSNSAQILRPFPVHILGDSVKSIDQRVALIEEWYQGGGVLLIGYEMFRLLIQSKFPKRRSTKKNDSEVIDIEKEELRQNSIRSS